MMFWRPSSAQPSVARATTWTDPGVRVRLAFAGTSPQIAALTNFGTKGDDGGPWVFHASDDGKTWAAPVRIPTDGNFAWGTNLAIAATPGAGAVSATLGGGNSAGVKCGGPKLSRTTDFTTWTTCSPTMDATTRFNYQFPALAYTSDGKLVVAFYHTDDQDGWPRAILLYREQW
jgi:hypothetical protein